MNQIHLLSPFSCYDHLNCFFGTVQIKTVLFFLLSKLKHQIKSKASRNDFQHINRRQVLRSTMNFVQKARPPPFNSLLNIETTNRVASIEIERYI